jgi:hypothetical protein
MLGLGAIDPGMLDPGASGYGMLGLGTIGHGMLDSGASGHGHAVQGAVSEYVITRYMSESTSAGFR